MKRISVFLFRLSGKCCFKKKIVCLFLKKGISFVRKLYFFSLESVFQKIERRKAYLIKGISLTIKDVSPKLILEYPSDKIDVCMLLLKCILFAMKTYRLLLSKCTFLANKTYRVSYWSVQFSSQRRILLLIEVYPLQDKDVSSFLSRVSLVQ